MATLHASALVSYSIGIFRRPSAGVLAPSVICITPRCPNSDTRLDLRSRTKVIMHVKNRWSPVFASKSNPSDEKNTSDDAPSGPPFLTYVGLLYP